MMASESQVLTDEQLAEDLITRAKRDAEAAEQERHKAAAASTRSEPYVTDVGVPPHDQL